MSGVQRSAKSSAPLATGQNCPYPPTSRECRRSSSAASSKSGLVTRTLRRLAATGLRVPSGREESTPSRLGERFELRVAAELEQDRADVIANRDLGDAEPGRDHLGRRALRDQLEHFVLSRREVRLW